MSGDTTSATPSPTSAGAWKQIDFPAPVGITTSESRDGQRRLHRLALERPEAGVAPVALQHLQQGVGGGQTGGGHGRIEAASSCVGGVHIVTHTSRPPTGYNPPPRPVPQPTRCQPGRSRRSVARAWCRRCSRSPRRRPAHSRAGAPDLETTLARAAERVADYFARAQSLVCLEIVHMQPLGTGLGPDGVGRTVESELRLSWDPGRGRRHRGGNPAAGDHGQRPAAAQERLSRLHHARAGGRPRRSRCRCCCSTQRDDYDLHARPAWIASTSGRRSASTTS